MDPHIEEFVILSLQRFVEMQGWDDTMASEGS